MNVFVCVKQTPDIRSEFFPNSRADYIDTEDLHWNINPEDECAVEQAVLVREQKPDTAITALRVGSEKDTEALIYAMAMGADDSIHILAEEKYIDPYITARSLSKAIEISAREPDLILCGNKSFGEESCQVPQLLAGMLGFPCITRVMKFAMNDRELFLDRQIDGGVIQSCNVALPAVIACSYGINNPRYAPIPLIKKARLKPMLKISLHEAGLDTIHPRLRYSNFRPVPAKKSGRVFDATDSYTVDRVVAEVIETIRADIKLS